MMQNPEAAEVRRSTSDSEDLQSDFSPDREREIKPQNHGIIEYPELEVTHKGHHIQPLALHRTNTRIPPSS